MSSIKTTKVDGDVSVGRNVAVGGQVTVQGRSQFKGSVKIDGWLDAKNIKGANKGIFTSTEKLKAAYPFPHDGWWAIVGTSLPGPIYVGDGGEWVATGKEGGSPTVDSEQYNEAVAELQGDMALMQQDIKDIEEKNKAQDTTLTTQGNSINAIQSQVNTVQTTANEANTKANSVGADLASFKATKGAANGLAPLGDDAKIPATFLPGYVDDVIEFDSCIETAVIVESREMPETTAEGATTIYYSTMLGRFIIYNSEDSCYYTHWNGVELYQVDDKPISGKVYVDKSKNITYRWSGSTLVAIGSDLALGYTPSSAFPGSDGKQLQEEMQTAKGNISSLTQSQMAIIQSLVARSVVNVNYLFTDLTGKKITFAVALDRIANFEEAASIQVPGVVLTFFTENGWQSKQWTNTDDWATESNWTEFGANGESIGNTINVNALCENKEYSLSTAIEAVQELEQESGLSYFKSGVVLTFKTADVDLNGAPVWLAYQFTREVADINSADEDPWVAFGAAGGGSEVNTSDEPEYDGKDAFSTGGAYKHIPVNLSVNTETDGVVKISMKNAEGEQVGEECQFAVGTGSGGGSGTIVTISPENSPLYAKAGGDIVMRASIRSITTQGTNEQSNIIERVELHDRDSGQLLETYRVNKASSADNETFDFEFDLSSYFPLASSRKFRFVAYDDSGNYGSRNVNVTAVDITIKSEQTLNYTSSTALTAGGSSKRLPMYRFPNNASDKGILCTTEILLNGEWKVLGTATISDTYSHSISINPTNCCGEVLSHGAYPIRIHGVDIASGVIGNYLHTAIMVIEEGNTTPIVVSRWLTDSSTGSVKQYETISIDFAAYSPASTQVSVEIIENVTGRGEITKSSALALRSQTYTYTQRISGYEIDGSITVGLYAKSGMSTSMCADFIVMGTLIDVEGIGTMLMYEMDMSARSNSDADKSIVSNGYTLSVHGANYSTNGFVKDSFGTESYGTENDKGIMALRFAENLTGELDYQPFNQAGIEANGAAIQFRIKTKNIADDEGRLISCISNGIGFYVTGKNVVFTTDNAATVAKTITAALKDDSITDVIIVIEPTSQAPYSGIGVVKMYFDGELIGACYYNSGSFVRHSSKISFNGSCGDLYLYSTKSWETYYSFEQSFNNYLLNLNDTDFMISEYRRNLVMSSQAAEGKPATNRPQMSALGELGIPYVVICKSKNTEDVDDNYPEYLESLDGDKKTSRLYDWYFYFPSTPWRNIVIEDESTTNQGTTSSMRPIKNKKGKSKKAKVRMMYERSRFTDPAQLAEYDALAALAKENKVQFISGCMPTDILCIKVDYSESGGANNGASTNLYNDLTRALGANYMTPAQNAYTGEYELNPCISSLPIALFRTDKFSTDATSPSYGYFHAKANLNHDKGDAKVFGFESVPGYNEGCLNYGDFYELIASRGQSLENFLAQQDKSQWEFVIDEEKPEKGNFNVVVLSEFCGPNHRIFRRANNDSEWEETTGTMSYSGGRWRITGDVVNPVENYELLKYNAMDWFQGVKSIDDMLAPNNPELDDEGKVKDATPIWLTYFESRYPDNDALNSAYEDGRKVPYQLFRWLEWCEQCNQNLGVEDGSITVDGVTMEGTEDNRLLKFKRELHNIANVYSMICYHIFTDYFAAVDQRSKNMMVGFYLDTDGVTRMYLNHLYDGDTILGSDNDCGLTIPALLDPNNDPNGYYQGHESVLFTQLSRADYIWLTDYVSDRDTTDTTRTTTVASIASLMRSVQLSSGLRPFSPQGVEKYWITDRLSKWPKLVSSYDGIRKYIEASKANSNYFFALHGLSIQRLQDFVKTRFLYRDGYYQCGDTFASAISMRCTGENMTVTIKAAKDGFFGIGVDQASTARESVYLREGESATLRTGNTNTGGGVMLYVFGAENIGELDLTNATPKQQGWDISNLKLIRKLKIGGENYAPATTTGEELSTLNLGQLPFLEELDVRNFPLKSIDATYCPRLKQVLAEGSSLKTFIPAETSPIEVLTLPDTMEEIVLNNLPNLTYPGGLTIAGINNVTRVFVNNCEYIDTMTLLEQITTASSLKTVRIPNVNVSASVDMLRAIKDSGAIGLDANGNAYDENGQCSGITGRWILTELIEDSEVTALQEYFKELSVYNAQFSQVIFNDEESFCENITNMDNKTGYLFDKPYEKSGHVARIEAESHAYQAEYDSLTGKMKCRQLSDSDYNKFADGTPASLNDSSGQGFDIMKRLQPYWYKGVNDYKNQQKHLFFSSQKDEPMSTANNTTRKKLSEIILQEFSSVFLSVNSIGSPLQINQNSNHNTYKINVDGMKQVRFPGVNSNVIGGAFVDDNNNVVSMFNMLVSHEYFDFVPGEYVFCDVPQGAKHFVFTSQVGFDELEAIAVDSNAIEAIEPDWVHTQERLVGVYGASIDNLMRLRSLSGAKTRMGTSSSVTSAEWTYDSEGNITNTMAPSSLNYTMKDFQNLAQMRGKGFQLIDYEMSKDIANLVISLIGTRDAQKYCGYGCGQGYTTGENSLNTYGNQTRRYSGSNIGNLIFGIQNFIGCNFEWMDNVAINVSSYSSFLKNQGKETPSDVIDRYWKIYDRVNKTERKVLMCEGSGYCIGRVRFGRYCDIVASYLTSDKTDWNLWYSDKHEYSAGKSRVVGRGGSSSSANYGLVYAYANFVSSDASPVFGSRLAFIGDVEIIE